MFLSEALSDSTPPSNLRRRPLISCRIRRFSLVVHRSKSPVSTQLSIPRTHSSWGSTDLSSHRALSAASDFAVEATESTSEKGDPGQEWRGLPGRASLCRWISFDLRRMCCFGRREDLAGTGDGSGRGRRQLVSVGKGCDVAPTGSNSGSSCRKSTSFHQSSAL